MEKQSTYIAIDLKSFYASVECMQRNLDPMTTNLVVADLSRTEKTMNTDVKSIVVKIIEKRNLCSYMVCAPFFVFASKAYCNQGQIAIHRYQQITSRKSKQTAENGKVIFANRRKTSFLNQHPSCSESAMSNYKEYSETGILT